MPNEIRERASEEDEALKRRERRVAYKIYITPSALDVMRKVFIASTLLSSERHLHSHRFWI